MITSAESDGFNDGISYFTFPTLNKIDHFSSFDWEGVIEKHIWDTIFTPTGDRVFVGRSDAMLSVLSLPGPIKEIRRIQLFSDDEYAKMTGFERSAFLRCKIFWLTFAISPDAQTLSVCTANRVSLLNVNSYQEIGHIDLPVDSRVATNDFQRCAFSPDGRYLVTSFTYLPIMLWDIHNLTQPIWKVEGGTFSPFNEANIVFSPNGKFILCAGRFGIIAMVETGTGRVLGQFDESSTPQLTEIWDLDISSNGILATAHQGGAVRLWSIQL
ncbi:MAG: hypothetical protein M1485_07450 [Chloroflexi bacterium]|nr:hypothetical protein [Chloroflexota bacterium]